MIKSIKCSECGKVFKNTALANFHAEKSGHDQFEESTEEVIDLFESLPFESDIRVPIDQAANRRRKKTETRRAEAENGRKTR